MKIGILTLPLHTNYGGILQAYALQKVLSDLGHNVETLTLEKTSKPFIAQLKLCLKSLALFCVGRCKWNNIYWPYNTRNRNIKFRAESLSFTSRYISLSKSLNNESALKQYVIQNSFDAIIVGSDQVWRPNYGCGIELYFLSFLVDLNVIKKVAFAASFGTDDWEFTEEQTNRCATLAKQFDCISVRELSGVELCKDHLGVSACCVIDPTMLLYPSDYVALIENSHQITYGVENKLFSYILDLTPEKNETVKIVSAYLKLAVEFIEAEPTLSPYASKKHALNNPPKPVEQWLRSFLESEIVVTDSFHATVFSIIFHRPFIVLVNSGRGLARIESLLSIFGLTSRLVTPSTLHLDKNWLLNNIDWNNVDIILRNRREQTLQFINEAL